MSNAIESAKRGSFLRTKSPRRYLNYGRLAAQVGAVIERGGERRTLEKMNADGVSLLETPSSAVIV